jgi:hypothetical protein
MKNDNLPTHLELEALRLLLSLPNCSDESLRKQIGELRVGSRECTGVGMFVHFDVPNKSASSSTVQRRFSNLSGEAPCLQHGFGGVLFVENGRIDTLEFFTYDEPWPEELESFSLTLEKWQE